jgi:hypothetical protein
MQMPGEVEAEFLEREKVSGTGLRKLEPVKGAPGSGSTADAGRRRR